MRENFTHVEQARLSKSVRLTAYGHEPGKDSPSDVNVPYNERDGVVTGRHGLEVALAGRRYAPRLALVAYVFHSTRSLRGDVIDSGRSLIEVFKSGTVTTRFISYAADMSGSNYLQFANLKQVELFERTDSVTVLWGQFALPDVGVRAKAPIEYTYYLNLNDR